MIASLMIKFVYSVDNQVFSRKKIVTMFNTKKKQNQHIVLNSIHLFYLQPLKTITAFEKMLTI